MLSVITLLVNSRVFFDYPVEIRKAIYTTNAIESLYLALNQASKSGLCHTQLEARDGTVRDHVSGSDLTVKPAIFSKSFTVSF